MERENIRLTPIQLHIMLALKELGAVNGRVVDCEALLPLLGLTTFNIWRRRAIWGLVDLGYVSEVFRPATSRTYYGLISGNVKELVRSDVLLDTAI